MAVEEEEERICRARRHFRARRDGRNGSSGDGEARAREDWPLGIF